MDGTAAQIATETTLLPLFAPHTHSIVLIGPHELIGRCKTFFGRTTPVSRTVRCAWLFKEEFCHPKDLSISATIGVNRSIIERPS
jgi:hypothetical protein